MTIVHPIVPLHPAAIWPGSLGPCGVIGNAPAFVSVKPVTAQ